MAAYSESVGEQLACPICLNRIDDPRILPCLHSFCRRCLEQAIGRDQGPGRGVLQCPTCQQSVSLGPEGIDNLPSNLFVSNLFEAMVQHHEDYDNGERPITGTRWCSSCEEGSKATAVCKNCNEYLCDNCVLAHQRVRLTKDHYIERLVMTRSRPQYSTITAPLGSPSLSRSLQLPDSLSNHCSKHEHEILRLFCDTCSMAICRECTMVDHIGHNFIYLQEAIENSKAVTVKLITDAKISIKALEEGIETSQNMAEHVEVRSQGVANEVRATTRRHMIALEERERELLRRVEKVRQVKGKSLHLH